MLARGRPRTYEEARDRLQVVADRSRPVTLARDQTLPLIESLATMFPDGRLRRGITVAVRGPGSTTLGFALAASASVAGSWVAMVGVADANLATAGELGVALERVAVMHPPPAQWSATVAVVVGSFDIVVLAPSHRVSAGDARRLMARARERGSVLITLLPRQGLAKRVDAMLSIRRCRQGSARAGNRALVRGATCGSAERARPRQVVRLPMHQAALVARSMSDGGEGMRQYDVGGVSRLAFVAIVRSEVPVAGARQSVIAAPRAGTGVQRGRVGVKRRDVVERDRPGATSARRACSVGHAAWKPLHRG